MFYAALDLAAVAAGRWIGNSGHCSPLVFQSTTNRHTKYSTICAVVWCCIAFSLAAVLPVKVMFCRLMRRRIQLKRLYLGYSRYPADRLHSPLRCTCRGVSGATRYTSYSSQLRLKVIWLLSSIRSEALYVLVIQRRPHGHRYIGINTYIIGRHVLPNYGLIRSICLTSA